MNPTYSLLFLICLLGCGKITLTEKNIGTDPAEARMTISQTIKTFQSTPFTLLHSGNRTTAPEAAKLCTDRGMTIARYSVAIDIDRGVVPVGTHFKKKLHHALRQSHVFTRLDDHQVAKTSTSGNKIELLLPYDNSSLTAGNTLCQEP